jgi:hypothetical protein
VQQILAQQIQIKHLVEVYQPALGWAHLAKLTAAKHILKIQTVLPKQIAYGQAHLVLQIPAHFIAVDQPVGPILNVNGEEPSVRVIHAVIIVKRQHAKQTIIVHGPITNVRLPVPHCHLTLAVNPISNVNGMELAPLVEMILV